MLSQSGLLSCYQFEEGDGISSQICKHSHVETEEKLFYAWSWGKHIKLFFYLLLHPSKLLREIVHFDTWNKNFFHLKLVPDKLDFKPIGWQKKKLSSSRQNKLPKVTLAKARALQDPDAVYEKANTIPEH